MSGDRGTDVAVREKGLAPGPYLGASAVASAGMAALVLATTLPVAGVLHAGLTFLGVALVVRRLEELPEGVGPGWVQWLAERFRRLEDRFGAEFYGVAAVAEFIRAESLSLLETQLSLQDLLARPLGTLLRWFISEFIESLINGVWAALWWLQLLRTVDGLVTFALVVLVGWTVWRILDVPPESVTREALEDPSAEDAP